jgi:aspartyl protease family protein
MPDGKGPWQHDSRPKRAGSGARFWLFLALLLAVGIGVWQLAAAFPGQISSDWNRARLVQLIVILALVSGGLVFARRLKLKEAMRNIAIWAGVVAVLVLGFIFQDELQDIGLRVRSELIPGEPISRSGNELILSESADGHFYVMGEANGTRIRFLIDTGASDIVISPSDAARLGIDVKALDFAKSYQTANGIGQGASYRLTSLSIGPIAISDVPVSINRADMASSLLGMSFLRQFGSFEIEGRRLYLRSR